MRKVAWVLIVLSALGFIFAVVGSMTGFHLMDVWPEAYSRGAVNLALIAIALLLARSGAGADDRKPMLRSDHE